jgi:DNA-binding GntR family transcriptional regulator
VLKIKPAAGSAVAHVATFKANHAYRIIKRRILDGTYAPGDWLRLSQLARDLSLSEMPIREALRLLQKDGLVVLHLNRGAQVATLSLTRGFEIVETRMHLEKVAAVSSTCHHTARSIREMEKHISTLQLIAESPEEFAIHNREFCTALFRPCPNKFLSQHIQELWDQVWQYSTTMVYRYLDVARIEGTLSENRNALEGIKQKDASKVAAVFDERIGVSLDAWRQAADKEAPVEKPKRAKAAAS